MTKAAPVLVMALPILACCAGGIGNATLPASPFVEKAPVVMPNKSSKPMSVSEALDRTQNAVRKLRDVNDSFGKKLPKPERKPNPGLP